MENRYTKAHREPEPSFNRFSNEIPFSGPGACCVACYGNASPKSSCSVHFQRAAPGASGFAPEHTQLHGEMVRTGAGKTRTVSIFHISIVLHDRYFRTAQYVDHFGWATPPEGQMTYSQRYFYCDEYWAPPGSRAWGNEKAVVLHGTLFIPVRHNPCAQRMARARSSSTPEMRRMWSCTSMRRV